MQAFWLITNFEANKIEEIKEEPKKHKIKLVISYDGTTFCGWQRQPWYNKPSVQGILERGLSKIFNEPIVVTGASRTDAGVHAAGQVAHFWTNKIYDKVDLSWAMQSQLPKSVVIKDYFLAPPDFHATISATHKTYKYIVHNDHRPSALGCRFSHWVRHKVDLDHLNQSVQFLIGKHDFKSFQNGGTDIKTTVRTIFAAKWVRKSSTILEFSISGNGFLKQMVRNIVGTVLEMEHKKIPPCQIQEMLLAQDRCRSLTTAPPQGLYLNRVYYPKDLDNKCRRF